MPLLKPLLKPLQVLPLLLLLVLLQTTLTGCGQKGPLTLPSAQPTPSIPPAASAPAR
jgi:predicted small lipoprotein YifL